MDHHAQPLQRTANANAWLTASLIIVSLILLVFGNNDMTNNWKFAGSDVQGTLNNVGLALAIAAITQYYTDFRVRSQFYKDISDNIVANETLRESGIFKFFRDSKTCDPRSLLRVCRRLDIGVTYSDRFLKDHLGLLIKQAGIIKVRIFCCDWTDHEVINLIAKNTGRDIETIRSEFIKLESVVEELNLAGVTIELTKQSTVPHYSFYVIDDQYYFLTMSTFASRRSVVPLFQADYSSPLAELVRDDIAHILNPAT